MGGEGEESQRLASRAAYPGLARRVDDAGGRAT